MIRISENFPRLTGNDHNDIAAIYDYTYKLERELRYEIYKRDIKIQELEEKINEQA